MKFPDWNNAKQIITWIRSSGSYIVQEDGYALMQCGAYRGRATISLNNYPVLGVGSTDNISDNDFGIILVKKGDVFSFSYYDYASGAKDASIWLIPFRR